jgi:asparagine synthase (glutamine-hydrolysing)
MQDIYDEPFGDSSNIPTFLICRFARQHVTVALGGDGADELLGGYLHWSRHLLEDPAPPKGDTAAVRAMLSVKRLARMLVGDGQFSEGSPLAHRYARGFRVYFTPQEREQIGLTDNADSLIDFGRYRTGRIEDLLRFDLDLYLPGDILVKTDRASMANGLEQRAPFLDLDVASFCLSLPDELKVDARHEKLLLRHAYQHSWTTPIRNRPKQGFGGPMAEWLQSAGLSELKHDTLGDRNHPLFNILDFGGVQAFVDQNDQRTWSLLVLALWLAKHPCHLSSN